MTTKAKAKDVQLGWHFLPADLKLAYNDNRKVVVGETLSIPDSQTPSTCHRGMHASKTPSMAAQYSRGPVICRVEVWGDVDTDYDKFCGRHRRVLAMRRVSLKDMKRLEKTANFQGSENCSIETRLKEFAAHRPTEFNKLLEDFVGESANIVEVEVKPRLTEQVVLAQFTPGVVRTLKELRDALGDVYDVTPRDGMYDDLLDEILEDLTCRDDFFEISSFGGLGEDGYVVARPTKSKRRR